MKKLTTTQIDADMVLKYQVASEDLDALVSVRSDEDLKHMLDEYDRHESSGNPRLRAFLFPANPTVIESQTAFVEPQAQEQRYIDAINGIFRTVPNVKITPLHGNRTTFSISSACSSPKSPSPDSCRSIDGGTAHETITFNGQHHGRRLPMSRVHSSPSLCSLGNNAPPNNSLGNRQCVHQHHHYHYPNYHKQPHPGCYHTTRPPQDPHKGIGSERLQPALSMGRAEIGRSYLRQGLNPHHGSHRHHGASGGGHNNCGYYDECAGYASARFERADSLPPSPRRAYWDGSYYKGDLPN
ncbi:uncharacterized protein LOC115730297 [Rhodamnia argentea]|uniref:Uncharacterized protein LOC115730297 n=1 Tax=Rhodamnia argentea TaxID=178133 RepID=A0A8B8N341_9MYRT|nr:uncharacterized protein LOC115730297 [Rhodamnia argentea]